ncbi:hypothetical protein LPW36_11410 [Jinshanibacter sp. LJY008]|uniref:Uncharacterized protein n=1 Tax=Limnobaculum eriocheiris TaxID=2897391 RepID=A0A9X1MW20_9GAMM|nr:hypothetical protein [Limnobaculum eriocheiris]MCD1126596.1 hypothetical protein [Limnobaculum eriocheiris]
MKKLIPLILIPLLQACGDAGSDTELPTIKAKSAYTCSQYNDYRANGDVAAQMRILSSTLHQLDTEYTGSTPIEIYYRHALRSEGSYFYRLRKELTAALDKACLDNNKANLTDVATKTINQKYPLFSSDAYYGTCRAYNNGLFTYDDIKRQFIDIQLGMRSNEAIIISAIDNSPKYGEGYIKQELTNYCNNNLDAIVWQDVSNVFNSAYIIVGEDNRKAHIERNIEALRKQETEELSRSREWLATEIINALKDNKLNELTQSSVRCVDFQKRYDYGLIDDKYQSVFTQLTDETVKHLLITLTPEEQENINIKFNGNKRHIAKALRETCEIGVAYDSYGRPIRSTELEDALLKLL